MSLRNIPLQHRPVIHIITLWAIQSCVLTNAAIAAEVPETLSGTEPLTITQPLDELMVSGINRFAIREIARAAETRESRWKRDYSSPEAYEKSIAPNRERFRTIIGAVDPRVESSDFELIAILDGDSTAGSANGITARRVRWQVLDGVTGEGILILTKEQPRARAIAIPDADWTPEAFAGLNKELDKQLAIPRLLASNGVEVLIPTLISRSDEFSGNPSIRFTNQSHREFVYRMAFEMGRHVIGYEVQKILAAVDLLEKRNRETHVNVPFGVVGVGEGGLVAFYAAALDRRIEATLISGYFHKRDAVWEEPIYRNVWSLLTEFGDAEIASLIAPRSLIIEACEAPEVSGPPGVRTGRAGGAAPGKITSPLLERVREEFEKARAIYQKLNRAEKLSLVVSGEGKGLAGSDAAIARFLTDLAITTNHPAEALPWIITGLPINTAERQQRQFSELVNFTQKLMRHSTKARDEFWAKADRSSVEKWIESSQFYRDYIHDEMIGRLPAPTIPLNPRTRKIIDEPSYTGYEVLLDVYSDVVAGGILLLPKDLKPNEKRPVVVCQHGLEGTPMDTITTEGTGYNYYKSFSVELAKRGFITYAPQNPYRGKDNFRTIQRKSNPLKLSLFSYIIPQHERTLDWLSSLPNVDANRIGFYGLSYGGKTAVRVPPLVTRYALSICSADFDEWILKNVSSEDRYSYIFTGEYEIFEWNMGNVANYAELASLMIPRPFMVERGHHDGVAPDEWVAWEYAKARRPYVLLGLGDKTEIEYFNGPHSINGKGTFNFLHRHLDWPQP